MFCYLVGVLRLARGRFSLGRYDELNVLVGGGTPYRLLARNGEAHIDGVLRDGFHVR